jgi:ABC-2 type transport system ATP-binding protein
MIIEFKNVVRQYRIPKTEGSFSSKLKHLVRPRYDLLDAIKDVSFTLNKGELVGYIGPNGAGKSTTIKLLTGLLPPTSGSIRVFGMEPAQQRMELSRRIGMMKGQHSQLWWDLPASDSLDMLRLIYGIPRDDYKKWRAELVDRLAIGDFLHQPVRLLSLGQRMRVELAATVLHQPDLLLLDEPTIGLDVTTRQLLLDLLLRLRNAGITIILTTHNLDDVERICDRMLLLDKGQLVYDGLVSNFSQYIGVRHYISATSSNPDDKPDFPDGLSIVGRSAAGWEITYDDALYSEEEALALVAANSSIVQVGLREIDLEVMVRSWYQRHRQQESLSSMPVDG